MIMENKSEVSRLIYICDDKRHLICIPYSISNLHKMAKELGIKDHWFHMKNKRGKLRPHYDIPLLRIKEITSKCLTMSRKDVLKIIKHHID
jgi:hypothetical protein